MVFVNLLELGFSTPQQAFQEESREETTDARDCSKQR